MAIKFEFKKHHYAFPSKLKSSVAGHIFNILLAEDTDNGTVVGKGDYVSFDQYKAATAPTAYKGQILEQAADGTWYVEVKEVDAKAPAILIYEVPEIAETYDSRFTDIANFYNKKDSTVRGYELHVGDVYALSADSFTGTPAAKKTVTVLADKHVVG